MLSFSFLFNVQNILSQKRHTHTLFYASLQLKWGTFLREMNAHHIKHEYFI